MCILFLISNSNPASNSYKLILASNRDEFYTRPAKSAEKWDQLINDNLNVVYGGIDMESGREGGTWLSIGIDEKQKIFKIGALLNLTGEPKRPNALGRGPIVANYVKGNLNNFEYSNQLINGDDHFNSFNLVSIEIDQQTSKVIHTSNAPPKIHILQENLPYGFGNSALFTPLEKVQKGVEKFKNIIESQEDKSQLVDELFHLLSSNTKYWPDAELKRRAPNWGEDLSRVCVKMQKAGYGTRTKTIILIDANNRMDFYEKTMMTTDPDGEWKNTHIVHEL